MFLVFFIFILLIGTCLAFPYIKAYLGDDFNLDDLLNGNNTTTTKPVTTTTSTTTTSEVINNTILTCKYRNYSYEYTFDKDNKLIKIFNSCIDGCDANCEDDNTPKIIDKNNVKDKLFNCSRCKGNNFSISIKYEYPDEDELKELGFKDISNAFTWITVSLTCNNCGKKYKKFIDFES